MKRVASTPRNRSLSGNTQYLNKEALVASKQGDFNRLIQTIGNGAMLSCKDENRNNLMHMAVFGQHINVVSYLLQQEQSFDDANNALESPLFIALKLKRPDLAKLLLDNGYSLDAENHASGLTMLHLACSCPETGSGKGLVQRLLGQLGDGFINQPSTEGLTPLWIAMKANNQQAMQVLLNHGVDPNIAIDHDGSTPLHHLSELAKNEEGKPLLDQLIQQGADLDVKDAAGFTPLHWAARYGSVEAVNTLRMAGADLEARGWNGNTCLHFAAWEGHTEVVKVLLAMGMDIDTPNHFGLAPLHNAVLMDQVAVIELLLECGANVDAVAHGLEGQTCLHLACMKGMEDVVETLVVKWNAQAMLPDTSKNTPYGLAVKARQAKVQQLMESHFVKEELERAQSAAQQEVVQLTRALRYCQAVNQARGDSEAQAPGVGCVKFLSFEVLLRERRFPSFHECEKNDWHIPATEVRPSTSILYISLGYSENCPPPVNEIDMLAFFVSTVVDHAAIEMVWIAQSCLPDQLNGDQMHSDYEQSIPAAMLLCTHFIMLPELTLETGTEESGIDPMETAVTNLRSFLKQPRCYFEAMSGSITGSEMYLAFQHGMEYSVQHLDVYGGTNSGLGFYDAMQEVHTKCTQDMGRKRKELLTQRLNTNWIVMREPTKLLLLTSQAVNSVKATHKGFIGARFDERHHAFKSSDLVAARECIAQLDATADCNGLMSRYLSLLQFCMQLEGRPIDQAERDRMHLMYEDAIREGQKHREDNLSTVSTLKDFGENDYDEERTKVDPEKSVVSDEGVYQPSRACCALGEFKESCLVS
mmetsp:Transcript_29354/g.37847  ORF Transcript_29354/g.37847 Transcript_29354/m.37847 type:complete len:814 (+) Transcript_29354:273-2714(+)